MRPRSGSTPIGSARIDRPLRALRRRRSAARVADRRQPRRPDRPPRTYGQRDIEAGRADRARHALPHLLDDEADHVGRGDDAVRGGRLRAEGLPSAASSRRSPTPGCTRSGSATQPDHSSRRSSRCASGTCSPTRRASPTASTTRIRSTRMYRRAGFEWGGPTGADLDGVLRPAGPTLPLLFQPGTEWNYSCRPTSSAGSSRSRPGQSLDEFFRERIFEPLGMTDTGVLRSTADDIDRLAALYLPAPGTRKAVRARRHGQPARSPSPTCLVGRRRTGVDRRRLPPLHPDAARRGELDGVRLLGTAHGRLHDHATTCPAAPI